MDKVDVAIVGGGVSGLYTAWRLAQTSGSTKGLVHVYEASDRIGGRLHTASVPSSPVRVELGAMRFPASHKFVSSLLDLLKIPVEPFPNLALRQMYLRGTRIPITNDQIDGPIPYRLSPSESSNPNPFLLLVNALQKFVPANAAQFTLADWDNFFKTSDVAGYPYWMWGFWNLLARVLSDEAYQLVQEAIGIESSVSNWNASMSLRMMTLLLGDFEANSFSRPSNGWSELPEKLRAGIEAVHPGAVKTKSPVAELILTSDHTHPFTVVLQSGAKVKASRVVLALPRGPLERLRLDRRLDQRSGKFDKCIRRVAQIPAFRYYVSYKTPWWQTNPGFPNGYSVTDLPIKQVFYGAGLGTDTAATQRVLMASYADFRGVDFWRGFTAIAEQQMPPMRVEADGQSHDLLLESVEQQLKQIHQITGSLPEVDFCGYAEWSPEVAGTAWHAWYPGGDLNQWIPETRQPFGDHIPIYICGEAYSSFQGWVEGALESTENMLEKCFKLKRPSWLPSEVELGA